MVKALKVRDGSPLDVPMMLFGWDKTLGMHVYRGEKSKEDKDKRKTEELIAIPKNQYIDSSIRSFGVDSIGERLSTITHQMIKTYG